MRNLLRSGKNQFYVLSSVGDGSVDISGILCAGGFLVEDSGGLEPHLEFPDSGGDSHL